MARELRWWTIGTIGACLALAAIYLPPRGHSLWPAPGHVEREPASPYRLRERDLAQRLRRLEATARLLEVRVRVDSALAGRRARGIPGPVLLFSGNDTLPAAVRQRIAAQLDTLWQGLGLGVTKVGVGMVVDIRTGRQGAPFRLYLLPDSADRTTCLVQVPAANWSRTLLNGIVPEGSLPFRTWLASGLGPCAFYAAFGTPGTAIGRWLSARRFDLALSPAWDRVGLAQRLATSASSTDFQREFWFRQRAYRLTPGAIGCLARRDANCRSQVLNGSVGTDSIWHFLAVGVWRWDPPALIGDDHYLADVAATIGRARFQQFWNSELPVDTALAEALRVPVGEWTRRWEAGLVPKVRLGPAAPLSAVLLGLVLATLAVAWVTQRVRSREVR